ncbi:MAG TPA: HhH-GPD-type base excision DNA repair protein [Acidimicrobiales bacterium]|nr:HhH-GPD-type base excision DNA repair protein [Acidimicrobiales bacterium]
MAKLRLSGNPPADQLLSSDPLALLIGMVLDQQIPLERAFSSPYDLKQRLGGTLDAAAIAAMDPEQLAARFAERPALHRFPAANAKRVQELCRIVVDEYGGKAENVWKKAADGEDLYRRVRALPGFGEQKARIFIGLLGKQLGIKTAGWQDAAGRFGQPGTFLSVADIVDDESLRRVRAYKQELKAAAKKAEA